jgi:hypothetical protein
LLGMSLDTIATTFFGCAETPVWQSNGFNYNDVPECKSCSLRLVSPVIGTGVITPRSDGLLVDENPLCTLSVNGIQYNLAETILMIGGAHCLPGRTEPSKAELACYFKSSRDFSVIACLSFPIEIGTGTGNTYFKALGTLEAGRPVLNKIVPSDPTFLLYRGADLRGRTARNKVPSSFCDPVKSIVTYYVCLKPIYMTNGDYQRLVARAGAKLIGPPTPLTPVVNSRMKELASRVKGIAIGGPSPYKGVTEGALGGPGYPTKSMKCFRLDPNRDIVKDKVYVGGKGSPTDLATEIKHMDEDPGILPGDLQNWLSGALGFGVALILAAFTFVFIFTRVFNNYTEAQHLYDENPISAHTITHKMIPGEIGLPSFNMFGLWQWICSKVSPAAAAAAAAAPTSQNKAQPPAQPTAAAEEKST